MNYKRNAAIYGDIVTYFNLATKTCPFWNRTGVFCELKIVYVGRLHLHLLWRFLPALYLIISYVIKSFLSENPGFFAGIRNFQDFFLVPNYLE